MNHPSYAFTLSDDLLTFRFESISDQKRITKLIVYTPIPGLNGVYNLALLDFLSDGTTDDLTVSNNGDMPQILATVAQTMLQFLRQHPGATIAFAGSTPVRTRLYRVAISQNIQLIEPMLLIEGFVGGVFEPFRPNRPYDAFFIRLK
ncbi:hypothetical protein J2I47_20975 [Fibrella sp. HMF5335]|uniref:Uncharacterized protein n=1 Tax=Fibrella rubiginis TaxID=2817060 RepID=A0A939K7V3_9BACT|nr:hypothetical protein [Fibrella rubiginis]MBO0939040.1 hypothetical protein [Fibrella rubiginis]